MSPKKSSPSVCRECRFVDSAFLVFTVIFHLSSPPPLHLCSLSSSATLNSKSKAAPSASDWRTPGSDTTRWDINPYRISPAWNVLKVTYKILSRTLNVCAERKKAKFQWLLFKFHAIKKKTMSKKNFFKLKLYSGYMKHQQRIPLQRYLSALFIFKK